MNIIRLLKVRYFILNNESLTAGAVGLVNCNCCKRTNKGSEAGYLRKVGLLYITCDVKKHIK